MAAPKPVPLELDAGNIWLANCSLRPDVAHEAWAMGGLAPVHSTQWLVSEVQLGAALRAVQRIPHRKAGPLLIDARFDSAWWLAPLDTAGQLADVRHATVLPSGWPLHCPPTTRAVGSRVWLHAPDGSGHLMAPALLAAALGPGGGPRLPAEAFGCP
ncbi:hypothetical protein [Streptomyces luteocolor]|uniref:hypothetical protein n=1 Tax=Streptomyces luteocolor TaxID=285500 RepID=UPI0008537FC2|nr:hypothetical protein [Streptomyces luteocolor]